MSYLYLHNHLEFGSFGLKNQEKIRQIPRISNQFQNYIFLAFFVIVRQKTRQVVW